MGRPLHLREDTRDRQGSVLAEADAEPEELVGPVALFGREVLEGFPNRFRGGLHQDGPIALRALQRLAVGRRQSGGGA